jgi:hypothetical protein
VWSDIEVLLCFRPGGLTQPRGSLNLSPAPSPRRRARFASRPRRQQCEQTKKVAWYGTGLHDEEEVGRFLRFGDRPRRMSLTNPVSRTSSYGWRGDVDERVRRAVDPRRAQLSAPTGREADHRRVLLVLGPHSTDRRAVRGGRRSGRGPLPEVRAVGSRPLDAVVLGVIEPPQ